MIKVQPARSRVLKEESSERISLTLPAKGAYSLGGLAVLAAILWMVGMLGAFLVAWDNHALEWEILSAVLCLCGGVVGLTGAAECKNSWRLERTAQALRFTRKGLWGTRTRTWPADGISSLWVDETSVGYENRAIVVVGFRNGRSEDLLSSPDVEEVQWLAAMLTDPRGTRLTLDQPALAAEPVRRRVDPAVIPSTLAVRRLSRGAELTFLPLLGTRGRWGRLLMGTLWGLTAILGMSLMYPTRGTYRSWIARIGLLGILGSLAALVTWLNRSAKIQVVEETVLIILYPLGTTYQFKTGDLEFVQTFRSGRHAELQFLFRGRPKIRLLRGRPPDELEWAARYLRVAIKGRPEQESEPMRVDATVGDCRVCGEKMERRVIYCARCRTPHHEECWSYVGQCSTYGCREIRFTRV